MCRCSLYVDDIVALETSYVKMTIYFTSPCMCRYSKRGAIAA